MCLESFAKIAVKKSVPKYDIHRAQHCTVLRRNSCFFCYAIVFPTERHESILLARLTFRTE